MTTLSASSNMASRFNDTRNIAIKTTIWFNLMAIDHWNISLACSLIYSTLGTGITIVHGGRRGHRCRRSRRHRRHASSRLARWILTAKLPHFVELLNLGVTLDLLRPTVCCVLKRFVHALFLQQKWRPWLICLLVFHCTAKWATTHYVAMIQMLLSNYVHSLLFWWLCR